MNMAMQIAAYIAFTRIKELVTICVLQPFSPWLFARGPPRGPERLIRKLSGQIASDEALEEWVDEDRTVSDSIEKASGDPMTQQYRCTSCYLNKEKVYMHPIQRFGVQCRSELFPKYIVQGSWTRCVPCQKKVGLTLGSSVTQPVRFGPTTRTQRNDVICGLRTETLQEQPIEGGCHWCSTSK